jgi:hypothetical protein
MSYSKRIHALAQAELERRQKRAEAEQKSRHETAASKIPELEEIE